MSSDLAVEGEDTLTLGTGKEVHYDEIEKRQKEIPFFFLFFFFFLRESVDSFSAITE